VNAAKLVWSLSHDLQSGTVLVQLRGQRLSPARVELYRGWVHAVDLVSIETVVGKAPARGEEALKLILRRSDADWTFDAKIAGTRRGMGPFHPAATIRNFVGAVGDGFRAKAEGARLQLLHRPHPSCIGLDERALVAFLDLPRTWAEVEKAALCPPFRALPLLAFLEQIGALGLEKTLARDEALLLLELPASADPDAIKSAYRRLARALHPDAHPNATQQELRDLESRFAALAAAYDYLTGRSVPPR
jgi:DnaJ-domain-containing protein 1